MNEFKYECVCVVHHDDAESPKLEWFFIFIVCELKSSFHPLLVISSEYGINQRFLIGKLLFSQLFGLLDI